MKGEIIKCREWNERNHGADTWKYFRNYDGSLKQTGWVTHCPACKDHYFWTQSKRDAEKLIIEDYKKAGIL